MHAKLFSCVQLPLSQLRIYKSWSKMKYVNQKKKALVRIFFLFLSESKSFIFLTQMSLKLHDKAICCTMFNSFQRQRCNNNRKTKQKKKQASSAASNKWDKLNSGRKASRQLNSVMTDIYLSQRRLNQTQSSASCFCFMQTHCSKDENVTT